jgi:hypothetical protein
MRNKSRKVSKAKLRKTKRRAKLRRAIRGGAVALPKPGELNQAGALKKTEALKKMKAIKESLVSISHGYLYGENPYRGLSSDYTKNMNKYFEESGSYELMDILKRGFDGQTVQFDKGGKIISINGISGVDLDNLYLFLYIVFYIFLHLSYVIKDKGYREELEKVGSPLSALFQINKEPTKYSPDDKKKCIKELIFYAEDIKSELISGYTATDGLLKPKPSFSLPKLSFYKTKKVGSATANTTTKANANTTANTTAAKATGNATAITKAKANTAIAPAAVTTKSAANANAITANTTAAKANTNTAIAPPKNNPNNSKPSTPQEVSQPLPNNT